MKSNLDLSGLVNKGMGKRGARSIRNIIDTDSHTYNSIMLQFVEKIRPGKRRGSGKRRDR